MSPPSISVLVPAFNDGRYLDEALRSIAAQTLGSFEVIVSDDGSTDDTPAVAAAWAQRDPRFRLVRSETNRGMAENWNVGLRSASGEVVAKLDADDAWEPRFLELAAAELSGRSPAFVVFARTIVCDEALNKVEPWEGETLLAGRGVDLQRRQSDTGSAWYPLAFDDVQLWHSNAFLLRRADLLGLGGWDERWSCAADTDLILRLLELDRLVVQIPYVGVRYRRRASSVSHRAAEQGWKHTENVLVALGSLARVGRRFRGLRAMRQTWWRFGVQLAELRRDATLWTSVPARQRLALERALEVGVTPPWTIRCEGSLRLWLWRLLRQPRPRSSEAGP